MLATAEIPDCTAHPHRYMAQNRSTVLSCVPSSSNPKSLVRKPVFKSNSNDTVSCWIQQDKQATLASQPLLSSKNANYCTSRILIPREKSHFGSNCSEGRTPSLSPHYNKTFSRKAKVTVAQIFSPNFNLYAYEMKWQ